MGRYMLFTGAPIVQDHQGEGSLNGAASGSSKRRRIDTQDGGSSNDAPSAEAAYQIVDLGGAKWWTWAVTPTSAAASGDFVTQEVDSPAWCSPTPTQAMCDTDVTCDSNSSNSHSHSILLFESPAKVVPVDIPPLGENRNSLKQAEGAHNQVLVTSAVTHMSLEPSADVKLRSVVMAADEPQSIAETPTVASDSELSMPSLPVVQPERDGSLDQSSTLSPSGSHPNFSISGTIHPLESSACKLDDLDEQTQATYLDAQFGDEVRGVDSQAPALSYGQSDSESEIAPSPMSPIVNATASRRISKEEPADSFEFNDSSVVTEETTLLRHCIAAGTNVAVLVVVLQVCNDYLLSLATDQEQVLPQREVQCARGPVNLSSILVGDQSKSFFKITMWGNQSGWICRLAPTDIVRWWRCVNGSLVQVLLTNIRLKQWRGEIVGNTSYSSDIINYHTLEVQSLLLCCF